jgi:hypothetical protein
MSMTITTAIMSMMRLRRVYLRNRNSGRNYSVGLIVMHPVHTSGGIDYLSCRIHGRRLRTFSYSGIWCRYCSFHHARRLAGWVHCRYFHRELERWRWRRAEPSDPWNIFIPY